MDIIASGIITNDDLKELGINKLGDRIKIINEIKKINENPYNKINNNNKEEGEEYNNFQNSIISKQNEFEFLYTDALFPFAGVYSRGEMQDFHISQTLYYRGMSWNRVNNITIHNFDEYIAKRQNELLAHKLYYYFAAEKMNDALRGGNHALGKRLYFYMSPCSIY